MKKEIKKICEFCLSGEKDLLAVCLGEVGFFHPEKAAASLISFKGMLPSADLVESILPYLLQSFDPDRGLGNILSFAKHVSPSFWFELVGNHEALEAYLAVFSGSQHLSEIIFGQWEELGNIWSGWFGTYNDDFIKADLAERINQADSASSKLHAVKRFKDFWFLNIGARDLTRLDPTQVVLKRLSQVADFCLETVYDHCWRELEEKHGTPMEVEGNGEKKKSAGTIIGMGKLGGHELNFSSDIDLIFVFSSEKGETVKGFAGDSYDLANPHKISNQEFFTLLAQKITRVIGEQLKIFRVDLDLRPEGKSGAITQCLTGAEIYYESWGQTWERMAMIKARPVAGDRKLGECFLETVHPFVYRKYLDESSFNEIRTMRDRIKQKLEAQSKPHPTDVKLGDGGIREIEFIVQTFQVIYGGKDPELQYRGTMETLCKLALPKEEVEVLSHAYLFLRDIENRLQMLHGRQTHLLPGSGPEQTALARKMGPHKNWDSFMDLYQHHTKCVKYIFDKLFTPASAPVEKSPGRKRGKDKISPAQFKNGELEAYKDPEKIRSLISLLKEGHTYEYPTQRARELFSELLPHLLEQIKSQPDPELALNRLEEFTRGYGAREALFGFLLENKYILELLIQILGTGGILCERLIQYPDYLDLISRSEAFWEEKSAYQMRREIEELLPKPASTKEKLDLLAKYKMEEEFRIGFRLIAKNQDPLPVFEELSQLAQLYLEQIFYLACHEISPADSSSVTGQLAVIAMGKLAGCELDFGSDLDIVFVSTDSGDSPLFHRICRKIIQHLQTVTGYGIPYRIDLDLRPYGKSGPLVLPISGFRAYLLKNAKPWERMAWIRSRVINGDKSLVCRIHESIKHFVYGQGLDKKGIDEIEQIWSRVHQEKITGQRGKVSLKFGSGGLFDLEFITQLFQLKWGKSFPDIQRAHIYKALLALELNECIPVNTARQLKVAYMFLRNLESRLRLTQNQPGDWIGLSDDQWEILSKRMRYDFPQKAGKHLQETFQTITTDIKKIKSIIDSLL